MASLTICIPTYNRAALVSELLEDIAQQAVPGLEVVVADDASPDGTPAAVEAFRSRIPGLRLVRHDTNIGLDQNFLAVVSVASNEFVWLMGDDDRLEPGGLSRVLDALERWPEVVGLTLGVVDYDFAMTRPTGLRKTPPTGLLHGVDDTFETLADLLGFMSALVIRRDAWDAVAARASTRRFTNFYVQVYIVGVAIGRDGVWGVVQEPCVRFRTENDQLQDRFGWVDRLRIDVVGYSQITTALFSSSLRTKRLVDERLLRVHGAARIVNAVTNGARGSERVRAMALVLPRYWRTPTLWTRIVPLLIAPQGLLRRARALYRNRSRSSGAGRAAASGRSNDASAGRAGS